MGCLGVVGLGLCRKFMGAKGGVWSFTGVRGEWVDGVYWVLGGELCRMPQEHRWRYRQERALNHVSNYVSSRHLGVDPCR